MGFKQFLSEQVNVKLPKPFSNKVTLDLSVYKETILKSRLKSDKKQLLEAIEFNKEIPVFVEEVGKCFMIDPKQKKIKAREVKSREDKIMCGVLINSLCIKEDNVEKYKNMNWNWEIPTFVWKIN